uniref:Guanylate cyclase n=1 Tax=Strongyloides stercoralis TaxID=6248 RepID=A0AAF5D181_STRER
MTNIIFLTPLTGVASSTVCFWLKSPIIFAHSKTDISLGFLFPRNSTLLESTSGFVRSAGVVTLVFEKIKKESILPDYNYDFNVFYDECDEYRATSGTYELIKYHNVDVIFGSTCNAASIRSTLMAKFYNKPTFVWGAVSSSDIAHRNRLPNIFSIFPIFLSLAYATIDVLEQFNWTTISVIYNSNPVKRCKNLFTDFEHTLTLTNTKVRIVYSLQTSFEPTPNEFDDYFFEVKDKARIIVSCFDNFKYKRKFLISMYENGLNNNEWVHINMDYRNLGFFTNIEDSLGNYSPFYKDVYDNPPDGKDDIAFEMAKKMLSVDMSTKLALSSIDDSEILENVKKWPFYCEDCNISSNTTLSTYAWYLYDAIYFWAFLINKTLPLYGDKIFNNYTLLYNHCPGNYNGMTGEINFGNTCVRAPFIILRGLDDNEETPGYITYNFSSISDYFKNVVVENFQEIMFKNWDNQIPLNVPICGYRGNLCPIDIFKDYLTEVIIVAVIITLTNRKKEEEMSRWIIPYISLTKPVPEKKEYEKSLNSLASNTYSFSSKKTFNNMNETNKYIFAYLNGEGVAGEKHKNLFQTSKNDKIELSKLIKWEHDNNLLQTDNSIFDGFFLTSLIKDLSEGLNYIHNSYLKFHGRLTSKNCFINDRWQLKISNFNSFKFRCYEKLESKNLLWTAPEILRSESFFGSQEGDIYSFAIICSEIVTKKLPWDYNNRNESIEELIYLLKKSGLNTLRPDIIIAPNIDIDMTYITLIRDCWSEDCNKRPTIKQILHLLRSLKNKKANNLMDHVFGILEEYSSTLRQEISERTREIDEEQKKTDLLLSKMLPSAVAQNLKKGKIIEPENFEMVTIFFADIVKFTDLSLKCSPMQLITLINELFTMFDNLIESYDVYKVETIGDGYLCVSGLPIRNNNHAEIISDLSINFMDICKSFTIPHLGREKINLRIGCNSGPCVAGVVGLTMPRYCLFGDTVNTASRMESNSRSGRIHIAESTFKLLNDTNKYDLECRGEIIIKGKGVMTTYWLNGYKNNYIFGYPKTDISLGFLFPKNSLLLKPTSGFDRSVGVVSLVFEQIQKEKLLPNYNYKFNVFYDECDEYRATSGTYELIKKHNVDVIFGSTCNAASIRSTLMAKFYDKPTFVWGAVSISDIADRNRLPNIFSTYAIFLSLAYATIDVLEHFNWTSIAVIYNSNSIKRCKNMFIDFERTLASKSTPVRIVDSYQTSFEPTLQELSEYFDRIRDRTRIIVSCFDENKFKRKFLIAMYENGLNNNEWVHINLEYKNLGFLTNIKDSLGNYSPFYKDVYNNPPDGKDDIAFEMAKKMLNIDLSRKTLNSSINEKKILENVEEWPFYCKDCNISNETALSTYAWYLYDAIYLWASLVNKTLPLYGDEVFNNYTLLYDHCPGKYFGMTGEMNYGHNCIRTAFLILRGLDDNEASPRYITYNFSSINEYSKNIEIENFQEIMFKNWDNQIPLNVPICGYRGNSCPINIFKDYLTETNRRKEEEMSRWMIPYISLMKPNNEKKEFEKSLNSLASNTYSISSRKTFDSMKETNNFIFVYLNGESIVGEKHKNLFQISKNDKIELSKLITLEHDNINKFYGMCLDYMHPISLWKFCSRGNLFNILQTDNSIFDGFFLTSLIKDLAEGLNFIHNSFLKFHGKLTSKNCYINDKWQLKISNFNSFNFRCNEKLKSKHLLWTAPEILRSESFFGSQEGDIYSFAIICSEIVTKKLPWDYNNRNESIEELIYLIKKSGLNTLRPDIIIAPNIDIDMTYITLIRDCWSEDCNKRPTIKQILHLLKSLKNKKATNLMDHVFGILEEYSSTLRQEILERTREIDEEQKRTDILLSKMLPPAVAQNLKKGKIVEPENFEMVTIFFADIVKFTDLSLKCSPMQLITLVNELFTMFDNLIESFDVYKVETIGDGYLCVSGLPNRNNNHAEIISDLSINFMDICKSFKISHLGREKINLRIGCNSGPCVAGVVGLTMPRYCLFGDTVNTASRMESNSRSGRIHIAESTFKLLNDTNKYDLECRGEIIIKGKGVMTTYWLNGYKNN